MTDHTDEIREDEDVVKEKEQDLDDANADLAETKEKAAADDAEEKREKADE